MSVPWTILHQEENTAELDSHKYNRYDLSISSTNPQIYKRYVNKINVYEINQTRFDTT